MVIVGDDSSDPVSVVLTQDKCYSADGIDCDRWMNTVFLPLTLLSDGNLFVIDSTSQFHEHLKALEEQGMELGVTELRTRILSHIQPSENMSIVCSIRDRLSKTADVIGSSSITWTLMRTAEGWRINQTLFNEGVYDPSVVAQVFLGQPNRATS